MRDKIFKAKFPSVSRLLNIKQRFNMLKLKNALYSGLSVIN